MRVRVIGVGSGTGDDAAGLAVIEWLASQPRPQDVSLARCERPLPDLLEALDGADAAILIDAARGGDPPGRVRRIDEAAIEARGGASSHGYGTFRAVSLARALDRAPRRIVWLAIAIAAVEPGRDLSPPVRAAVPVAGRLALEEACKISALTTGASPDA